MGMPSRGDVHVPTAGGKRKVSKPFAGYATFAACMAANSDKENPSAYCATIQRAVEKADEEYATTVSRFEIVKIDEAENLIFGWASVAVKVDGSTVVDSQQDVIDIADLEPAAYSFMLALGDANEMHSRESVGRPVESFVVTPEKLEKMGLRGNSLPLGWWLGFKVQPQTLAKVKAGDLRMLSIEGIGERIAA